MRVEFGPAFNRLDALYERAGLPTPRPETEITEYVHDRDLNRFLTVVLAMTGASEEPSNESEKEQLVRSLHIIENVFNLIGCHDHNNRMDFELRQLSRLSRSLKRNAGDVKRFDLNLLRGDDIEAVLCLFWDAAIELGLAKRLREKGRRHTQVNIAGQWKPAGNCERIWLCLLQQDDSAFQQLYERALSLIKTQRRNARGGSVGKLKRQFRELRAEPSKDRLIKILQADSSDMPVAHDAVKYAMYRNGCVADPQGDVTHEDARRLGEDPEMIRSVAKTVLTEFRHQPTPPGPAPDYAFERFADALCQIYKSITGNTISYNTATQTSLQREPNQRYGLGLDFLRAGLQLIDPATNREQARSHIERFRRQQRGADKPITGTVSVKKIVKSCSPEGVTVEVSRQVDEFSAAHSPNTVSIDWK